MDFRRVMGMVPATCTYWKNASCFKGDRCTFFHGFICRDDGVCSDPTCDKSHFKQKDPAITQASGVGQSYQRPQLPYLKNSATTPPVITPATTTTIRKTETQNQTILIPHQVLQAQTRAHPAFKPSLPDPPYKRSEKSKSRSRSRSRSRSYSPRRRRRSSSRSPSPRNDRDRGRSYRHKRAEKDSYYDSKDSSRSVQGQKYYRWGSNLVLHSESTKESKFKPIGDSDSYRSIDESSSKERDSSYHRSSSSKSSGHDSYDSKSYSKNSSRKRSDSREK